MPFLTIHMLEVQSLDVISINVWHILISLLNLVILFFILKKLLFKPVRKLFAERQAELEHQYAAADAAEQQALAHRSEWEKKLKSADEEAEAVLRDATDTAKRRAEQITEEAAVKADGIVRRAQAEAELERKKAAEGIKREIVDVSAALAEKMLEREVKVEDHRAMIDSFIDTIGDEHDGNQ